MTKLDLAFQENFKLKREIAQEKKRYLDLMSAFLEVRNEQKNHGSGENSFVYDVLEVSNNNTPQTPAKGQQSTL